MSTKAEIKEAIWCEYMASANYDKSLVERAIRLAKKRAKLNGKKGYTSAQVLDIIWDVVDFNKDINELENINQPKETKC